MTNVADWRHPSNNLATRIQRHPRSPRAASCHFVQRSPNLVPTRLSRSFVRVGGTPTLRTCISCNTLIPKAPVEVASRGVAISRFMPIPKTNVADWRPPSNQRATRIQRHSLLDTSRKNTFVVGIDRLGSSHLSHTSVGAARDGGSTLHIRLLRSDVNHRWVGWT